MSSVRRRNSPKSDTPAIRNPRRGRLIGAATGRTAMTVYAVVGVAGLSALAIAAFGPRRFQRQILTPMKTAMDSHAEKLWSEAGPLRAQIGALFARAQDRAGRDRLARGFQSWIGHFHAS